MIFENNLTPAAAPAVYDSDRARWWTFGQLHEVVLRVSWSLQSPRKALAFCFCRNDIGSVIWYLAALEAGHAVALLDAELNTEFKAKLISRYLPDLILSSRTSIDYASAFDQEYLYLTSSDCGVGNFAWRRMTPVDPEPHSDLALLLSTSGSTGSPKFVRLSKRNLLSNAASICEALAIGSEDYGISSLPFHYSYGLSLLNTHLLAGARMIMTAEGLTTPSFWTLFRDHHCTSFAGVPYSYQILRRLSIEDLRLPSLRVMTQAGGKLQNDLIAHFHGIMAARNGKFFVMYGQTEATARITVLPAHRLPEKLGSVGLAIPGGSLAVRAENALTAEPHKSGELIYTGPNVMLGYAECREDLTLGDLLEGQLATGDLAHFDDSGFVHIEGRLKRDAKVFGLRVNLDEVENILRIHGPAAAVAGQENLVIFCEQGTDQDFARYRQELATKLMVHHSAFRFRRVDELPRTSNGKINYSELTARL